MKEPYTEGLAIHGDPESCVVTRKDAGEALTGARAGRAIEPRNQGDRGAQAVKYVEGNIGCGATREPQPDPVVQHPFPAQRFAVRTRGRSPVR